MISSNAKVLSNLQKMSVFQMIVSSVDASCSSLDTLDRLITYWFHHGMNTSNLALNIGWSKEAIGRFSNNMIRYSSFHHTSVYIPLPWSLRRPLLID